MVPDASSGGSQELRVNRLSAVESDVVEQVVEDMRLEYHWDGDLVIENVDEETKREIAQKCRDRASRAGRMSDYEGAQWCQDAAYAVEEGVLNPMEETA